MLIKPICRSEEQITLQGHALDLCPVIGQERQLARTTIQRGMVFRTIKVEFDDINSARTQRKSGTSDHYPDQHASDEPPIHDQQNDTEKRQVFDEQQSLR